MKIADSAVHLYSQHTAIDKTEQTASLTVWKGEQPTVGGENDHGQKIDLASRIAAEQAVKVSLSQRIKNRRAAAPQDEVSSRKRKEMADLRFMILKEMIERLTGRKVQDGNVADIVQAESGSDAAAPDQTVSSNPAATGDGQTAAPDVGVVYSSRTTHYEAESTNFSAQGKIVTTDGRQIDFSAQLTMNREYFSQQDVSVRAGQAAKDPLVVNFDGTAAELTQTAFQFDLNADGTTDQINFVAPGSGFLALDKNGDMSINDGSELFGTKTGNGFADLAAYDGDGNNWIDENDAVFGQLRIWAKDSAGNDQLFTLQEKGIGALYLGNADTPFSLKNQANDLVGQVRSTGIFLQENGGVGTLQQVDLVV